MLNLTLLAPAGFGHIPLAERLEGSAVGRLARRGVPLALSNPLTAAGIYMVVVARGHPPEAQLLGRVIRRAFSAAPGALAANEAIVAAARDRDGFAHRPVRYHGPVSVLWGASDILLPRAPDLQRGVWARLKRFLHFGHGLDPLAYALGLIEQLVRPFEVARHGGAALRFIPVDSRSLHPPSLTA